jgi:hypothetical protein
LDSEAAGALENRRISVRLGEVLCPEEVSQLKPATMRIPTQGRLVPAAHLLAFLIASSGAFLPRNDMLLPAIDGEFTRTTAILMHRFAPLLPQLSMAPFEGLGTMFLYDPLLSPSLLPIALLGERVGVWLSFMICAGLIFFSTYMLGQALGMGRGSSLMAAWAMPPLCLPYQPWLNLYLSYCLNPLAGDTISFAIVGLALFAHGYTTRHIYRTSLGLTAVVVWLFLANPPWIMLLLPTAIAMSAGIISIHARRPDFLSRTTLLLLPSLVFVSGGGAAYLLGLYSDTAADFFTREMNGGGGEHMWRFISVATAWNDGIDPIGGTWVGLALVGLSLAIWRGPKPRRILALSVLGAIIFFWGYGIAYMITPRWVLPYPIYFEFILWPFYSLFAAHAIGVPVGYLAKLVRRRSMLAERFSIALARALHHLGLLLPTGALLGVLLAAYPFTVTPNDLLKRPAATSITTALHSAIGIAPDTELKGYVATLTGFGGPGGPPTDWVALLQASNEAFLAFGNPYRLPYLWRFDIPTFEAYSQTVEPALYAVVSRLLDRPGDGQTRNIIIVTRTNVPLMESLGVRFLITDYPLPSDARLSARLVAPKITHYLYELPDPNYGSYSPTAIVVARNATEVLRRIANRNFDFRHSVVLDEPLNLALEPAQRSIISVVRGGLRLRAQSAGVSLLLLPIQFSECLATSEHQGGSGNVIAIRRANLAETAVVFRGTIDVTLSLQVSPFWAPYCRLHDAHEMRTFGLADVPRIITTGTGG